MRARVSLLLQNQHLQLLLSLLLFFLLRFPSLFEPYWYGDEGIYEAIGLAIRHGRILYSQIFDNKPPLLYLIYALFSGNQFEVRLFSLVVGLMTVTVFFCFAKRLFRKSLVPFLLSLLLAILFGTPYIEGNIANAENFMLLPILLAVSFIFLSMEVKKSDTFFQNRHVLLFSAGILLALATLTKIVAVFDSAACIVFIGLMDMATVKKLSFKRLMTAGRTILRHQAFLLIGYVIPLVFTVLFFVLQHAFTPFLQATLSSNVGYVGYNNTFIIPQGLLILKLLLLFIYLLLLLTQKKKLSDGAFFVLIWLGFSLFNIFFSQRPYTHYALLLLPSILLSLGYVITSSKHRAIFIACCSIAAIITIIHFSFYGIKKSASYYHNFLTYISGHESFATYAGFFDKHTPEDYDIATYLTLHNVEKRALFVWGDDAQLYKLTNTVPPGRYTVAYHISQYRNGVAETTKAFQLASPGFVVLTSTNPIPISLKNYAPLVTIDHAIIYERTF